MRPEPYWHRIEPGLFLGYRKSKDGGAWIARRYDAKSVRYLESRVALADDYRDADGSEVLTFGQAQRRMLAEKHHEALSASGQLYTVADAVADYVDYLRAHRKSAEDSESKLKTYVIPQLGTKRVADLTTADFETWLTWALKRRRKVKKSGVGDSALSHKEPTSPDELAERQRRRTGVGHRIGTACDRP